MMNLIEELKEEDHGLQIIVNKWYLGIMLDKQEQRILKVNISRNTQKLKRVIRFIALTYGDTVYHLNKQLKRNDSHNSNPVVNSLFLENGLLDMQVFSN